MIIETPQLENTSKGGTALIVIFTLAITGVILYYQFRKGEDDF